MDPACGSGAFLNKAADVLLEIHEAIHELLYKENKSLDRYLDNIGQRREILLNNIYGVDLNEESVEITKLSLFLKVCKKGLALPNLDDNIKCGNSLIDDQEFAGTRPLIGKMSLRPFLMMVDLMWLWGILLMFDRLWMINIKNIILKHNYNDILE